MAAHSAALAAGPGRDSGGPGRETGGPGREAAGTTAADRRRWLVLAVIAAAQLMIVLDLTVMNLALPSAQ